MGTNGSVEVRSVTQLREIVGVPIPRVATKARPSLVDEDKLWLAASPFCLIATSDAAGNCDVSPKGDPPGFTHVLDDTTIAIPDRPGNKRVDGFCNVLANPHVGLVFLVPGRGETLRINGRARLLENADWFDDLVVKGNRPALALEVSIDQVFFHCSKAFLRSQLWNPDSWHPDDLPSRAQIAQTVERPDEPIERLEQYYGEEYADKLY